MTGEKLFAERYLPVRKLGKGGMGEVWLVQDALKSNMPVALKFVCTELANDTRAINDLSREVVNAQKLTHSNILRIFELMKHGNTFFIAMEYVAGEDLNKKLGCYQQEGHNFSLEEVLACARQICPALDYAHDQKVLHLDIKPSNIICDERGNYKLMDFGIARSAHDSMTRVTRALGYTGGYASPEQVTGQTLTRRTDIYCLAATFYDLLTGKVPCPSDYATVNTVPASIPGVPQAINDAIMAGLAKSPEDRPAKAGDLLNLLLLEDKTVVYSESTKVQDVQLKTCPQCGSKVLRADHRFCSKCGFVLDKLISTAIPSATPPKPIATYTPEQPAKPGPIIEQILVPSISVTDRELVSQLSKKDRVEKKPKSTAAIWLYSIASFFLLPSVLPSPFSLDFLVVIPILVITLINIFLQNKPLSIILIILSIIYYLLFIYALQLLMNYSFMFVNFGVLFFIGPIGQIFNIIGSTMILSRIKHFRK